MTIFYTRQLRLWLMDGMFCIKLMNGVGRWVVKQKICTFKINYLARTKDFFI